MVKASDITKDIEAITSKTKTAFFTYDELHNDKVSSPFFYDWRKVVSKVSEINGRDMSEELKARGILKPLAFGEYAVEVGNTTRTGGGLNCGGLAFFSHSVDNAVTMYHEAAHSLQKHYDLFNEETIDKVYQQSEERLNKEEDKEKLSERQVYAIYLREMHADCFAYTAMMLRAENPLDFFKQAMNAYRDGVGKEQAGLWDFNKKYDTNDASKKYYATYPIIKEAIKFAYKIRKEGRLGEFFDKDSVLDDEKLARVSRDIVLKKGYSPRTLKSFFNRDILDGHSPLEHGWRRDAVKTLVLTIALTAPAFASLGFEKIKKSYKDNRKEAFLHQRLERESDKKLNDFIFTDKRYNTLEEQALYDYGRLYALINKTSGQCLEDTNAFADLLKDDLRLAVDKGGLPETIIKAKTQFMQDYFESEDKRGNFKKSLSRLFNNKVRFKTEMYSYFLKKADQIVKANADNPYFKAVVCNEMGYDEIWQKFEQKQKEPLKTVLDINQMEVKARGDENVYFSLANDISALSLFADKYDKSGKLKELLVTMAVKAPSRLSCEAMKTLIENNFMPERSFNGQRRKFKQEFDGVIGQAMVSYFKNEDNPEYLAALREVATVPFDEMENKARERLEAYQASLNQNSFNETKNGVLEASGNEGREVPREGAVNQALESTLDKQGEMNTATGNLKATGDSQPIFGKENKTDNDYTALKNVLKEDGQKMDATLKAESLTKKTQKSDVKKQIELVMINRNLGR